MSDDTERLTIDAVGSGPEVVLVLAGEVDPHTAPMLESAVSRALNADTTRLVFDLEKVVFIDSSGLRAFLSAHREVIERGGTFLLRSPSDTTRRLLDVTGLDTHLDVES